MPGGLNKSAWFGWSGDSTGICVQPRGFQPLLGAILKIQFSCFQQLPNPVGLIQGVSWMAQRSWRGLPGTTRAHFVCGFKKIPAQGRWQTGLGTLSGLVSANMCCNFIALQRTTNQPKKVAALHNGTRWKMMPNKKFGEHSQVIVVSQSSPKVFCTSASRWQASAVMLDGQAGENLLSGIACCI